MKHPSYWVNKFNKGKKMSNNAKRNKQLNHGRTAATYFYLIWGH